MATIAQVVPISDTVMEGDSSSYTNQLNSIGGVGAVTYTTTAPSSALLVYPAGGISVTGDLTVGSYTVSGTSSDASGNEGVWSFTLTVTSVISPQTSVTPHVQGLPTGTEILVPFQIDPSTGGVAVVTDYVSILAQHIETIIMTAKNERVMLTNYGAGLPTQVFAPIYDATIGILQADIASQIEAWEPAVKVVGVVAKGDPNNPNRLTVLVQFSVVPFKDISNVSVTVGGTITQASGS